MNIYLLLQILFVSGDLAERREYELQRKRREFVAKRRSKQINMDITQLKKNVLIGVSIKITGLTVLSRLHSFGRNLICMYCLDSLVR